MQRFDSGRTVVTILVHILPNFACCIRTRAFLLSKMGTTISAEKYGSLDLENLEEVPERTALVRPTPKQSSFAPSASSKTPEFAAEAEPPQNL